MGATMTMLIGGGLFVALLALLWLNVAHHEEERAKRGAALDSTPPPPPGEGRCGLCEAPLRERRTIDEVVHEVEHRIESELAIISRRMAGSPDDAVRMYRQ